MKEELHLFVIWSNGRDKQKEILDDINKNFEIIKVYEVEWKKENFAKNLSRFYGTHLPKNCRKETYCGNEKFILVILKLKNPIYEKRMTTRGEEVVNIKMFDKKTQYRELTGGGDKVHGTNNEIETNHDLTLLLGKNIRDFLKECNKWNGNIESIQTDMFGAPKWNSVEDIFYALNNCCKYAILRNYESLPNEIYEQEHNDVDIICDSIEDVKYILNAEPTFEEQYRVQYKTKVGDRDVYFDLRHVGDNYYCEQMEKKILEERIYNNKGFYTLSLENYFYTLLYHALIQKLDFHEDYKKKLKNMNIEKFELDMSMEDYAQILKKWMLKNEFMLVKPNDKSVIFNPHMAEYFKPLLYRKFDVKEYEDKIQQLSQENEIQKQKINELTSIIEGMQDSRSWKITKPIRQIKNLLK